MIRLLSPIVSGHKDHSLAGTHIKVLTWLRILLLAAALIMVPGNNEFIALR